MDVVQLLLHVILLLWSISGRGVVKAASQEHLLAKPNCQSHCGNIEILFPFGIGVGCYLGSWFQVRCDESFSPPKPFLNLTSPLEVMEISVEGTLKIRYPITVSANCSNKPLQKRDYYLGGSPFVFSQENRFTVVGCGVMATLTSTSDNLTISATCSSQCDIANNGTSTCNGLDCSQVPIPSSLSTFDTKFVSRTNPCNFAFLTDQDWFRSFANSTTNVSASISDMDDVPAMLEWKLYNSIIDVFDTSSLPSDGSFNCRVYNDTSSTYDSRSWLECLCATGFEGNPYLINGCQDVNECLAPNRLCPADYACKNHRGYFECYLPKRVSPLKLAFIVIGSVLGALFLLISAWWLHKAVKKRKNTKLKEKFFKQNGGLLLEQQLSSGEVNVEKIKLFNSKELEKATDCFNVDRILGQGGQGTVYKGMLEDGRIVAVKQSKKLDRGEVGSFINEIVILS